MSMTQNQASEPAAGAELITPARQPAAGAELITPAGQQAAARPARGRLQVYLGVAPGAGKTYAMLAEGRRRADSGDDVVVGLAETHGRGDIEAMAADLEKLPQRQVSYRGSTFAELDVDALLARHPAVALVDELAHSCVPGSRHEKRWEDVQELLAAGIDVITSLNVQHLDSLNDAVAAITSVSQRETVPDAVVAAADRVEFVDIAPQRLRRRISRGGTLAAGAEDQALGGFYTREHLAALRALALGWLDERDLLDAAARSVLGTAALPPVPPERVVVALTGAPEGEHVLRRGAQIAASVHGELIGVHVREPSGLTQAEPAWLAGQRRLLAELAGRYQELAGVDVASTVLDFARAEGARQLVLGATRWSRARELLHGSVINKAIRAAGPIEVHVIPARRPPRHAGPAAIGAPPPQRQDALPGPRQAAAWALAVVAPVAVTAALVPLRSSLGLAGALLCALVAVVAVALLGGLRPALLATIAGVLAADFLFTRPYGSFRVASAVDVAGLVTFVVVAAAVGGLVDRLSRQGVQTAWAKAEAEDLARLAADTLAGTAELTEAVGEIRSVFGLDGVALLRRSGTRWEAEASAGRTRLENPDQADYSVDVAEGEVLALAGRRVTGGDAVLLRAFLGQLRSRRERAVLGEAGQRAPGSSRDAAPDGRRAGT
jgi:two-component system, OmpR family, sensor histidine kinase KdpD